MKKENEAKKSIGQHIGDYLTFYMFVCNFIATFYLVLVRVPNAPYWASFPIALGTMLTVVVTWFKR